MAKLLNYEAMMNFLALCRGCFFVRNRRHYKRFRVMTMKSPWFLAGLFAAACAALTPMAAGAAPRAWAKSTKAMAPADSGTVGSGNVAVIDPPVPHPNETPCVVNLYQGAVFGGDNVNFSYAPPAGCPGPYATIVLSVDVSLNAGIQYDRTGTIWIAGLPLWFGTTAEPSPQQAPSWHFERNVTDYTSTLAAPQSGFALIANYTNSTDTSLITSSAQLLFYPATASAPAPRVPDLIIPVASTGGGTVGLNSSTSVLSISPTLPTNIVAASMDVYLQGQSGDEFWYTCVPDALAGELESCGGGSLREGEITIDGTPAGVAPVSPWIFTGGIDPYLWTPIPGVQTLDFQPFRVELSPFAGVLSNGATHTIGLSVFGADNYFSVAGALFLYLDPTTAHVTGGVTKNTLSAAPTVNSTNTIASTSAGVAGEVGTEESRDFDIEGSVVTRTGAINYTVRQSTHFSNNQVFNITNSKYLQAIRQNTATTVTAIAAGPSATTTQVTTHTDPLSVVIDEVVGSNGQGTQATKITQNFIDSQTVTFKDSVISHSYANNLISTQDTLLIDFNLGEITGNTGQSSKASYVGISSGQPCYGMALASVGGILTSAVSGCR
jgi:hypothetical protein